MQVIHISTRQELRLVRSLSPGLLPIFCLYLCKFFPIYSEVKVFLPRNYFTWTPAQPVRISAGLSVTHSITRGWLFRQCHDPEILMGCEHLLPMPQIPRPSSRRLTTHSATPPAPLRWGTLWDASPNGVRVSKTLACTEVTSLQSRAAGCQARFLHMPFFRIPSRGLAKWEGGGRREGRVGKPCLDQRVVAGSIPCFLCPKGLALCFAR